MLREPQRPKSKKPLQEERFYSSASEQELCFILCNAECLVKVVAVEGFKRRHLTAFGKAVKTISLVL